MGDFSGLARTARTATIILLLALLSACDWDAFSKWWEGTPDKHVRISGQSYLKLSKGDPTDKADPQNGGYLCVIHNPGCGVGEDGEDTFFAIKQLPPFTTLEGFDFDPIPPTGMSSSFSGGPAGDGSFDTVLQPGTKDGLATLRVTWHNACVGPYAGKAAIYRVSLRVKTKGFIELGDRQFDQSDPAQVIPAPTCRSDPDPERPCGPSSIFIKMIQVGSSPGLVYAGTSNTGLVATCINRLQRLSASQVSFPVQLLKKGSESCSDAVVRLGPGIQLETTDQNQMDVFGEVNPKDPITFRACTEAGTTPPPFFIIVATFNGTPI